VKGSAIVAAIELGKEQIGAVEIVFRQTGAGPPLLMLHGMEGDHGVFAGVQDELEDTFTTIAFDQRDCGRSRWMGSVPEAYTIMDLAEDTIRLLDALGIERTHLLGNSVGGVIAQYVATTWPERVDRLVLGLTFPGIAPLEHFNPAGIAKRRELAAEGRRDERGIAELLSTPKFVGRHPEILQWLAQQRQASTEQSLARRYQAVRSAPGVDPANIRTRTLVIAAEQDSLVPPHVVDLVANAIPQSTRTLLLNVGHLAAVEDARQFADAVRRFLTS
jgi:pimeloyl-ACP methyl ester carboxylesterase